MTITARHALVTGGSRGIGRGIALKLADYGVHVAINYGNTSDHDGRSSKWAEWPSFRNCEPSTFRSS